MRLYRYTLHQTSGQTIGDRRHEDAEERIHPDGTRMYLKVTEIEDALKTEYSFILPCLHECFSINSLGTIISPPYMVSNGHLVWRLIRYKELYLEERNDMLARRLFWNNVFGTDGSGDVLPVKAGHPLKIRFSADEELLYESLDRKEGTWPRIVFQQSYEALNFDTPEQAAEARKHIKEQLSEGFRHRKPVLGYYHSESGSQQESPRELLGYK